MFGECQFCPNRGREAKGFSGGGVIAPAFGDVLVAGIFDGRDDGGAGDQGPFAAIRQRTRSDERFPDIGQMMIWQLYWEHTPMLVDDARGNSSDDIAAISRHDAEHITAGLARRYWPPDAAQLPWVTTAYPQ